ncbi:MAG: GntR family transcriptional regulator [Phyllobacteriaceae bacterium]|jgi:DNA-binding GntR family transcriptional regulator|nr:GntR family transcriptional regulator [Phyllobacteriaceae bacterium]
MKIAPLKHENLQAQVYERLCDLILQGGLEPGQSVTVATLADALQVSPMPIREAMTRLVQVGALTKVSGRSMGVPKLSEIDLTQLTKVRQEIECIALNWAIENRTDSFVAELDALATSLISAEKKRKNRLFINTNYQFHFRIYQQSGSDILVEIIRNLWLRITPYFHLLDANGHLKISNEIHLELIEQISAGDRARAAALLKLDIERAFEQLVQFSEL